MPRPGRGRPVPGAPFFSWFGISPYFSGIWSHSDVDQLQRCVPCEVFHSYNYWLIEQLSEGMTKGDRCSRLQRSSCFEVGGFAWLHSGEIIPEPVEGWRPLLGALQQFNRLFRAPDDNAPSLWTSVHGNANSVVLHKNWQLEAAGSCDIGKPMGAGMVSQPPPPFHILEKITLCASAAAGLALHHAELVDSDQLTYLHRSPHWVERLKQTVA